MSGNHVAAGRLAARRFDEDEVRQIRWSASLNCPLTRLADVWGVHIHTIRNIVYGRTYRDCGGPIREPRS
jgi:hypothetical protein